MLMEFYKLPVIQKKQETVNSCSLFFNIPENLAENFKYKAGQYLTIKIQLENREERRAYSISSAPNLDDLVRITIKNIDGGLVSSYLVNNVHEGDILEIMPPQGNFTVDPDPSNQKTYILIAAGSGITPLYSIAKTILHFEPNSKVILFYSNRKPSDIIFYDELKDLEHSFAGNLKILHFISQNPDKQKYYDRLNPIMFEELLKENLHSSDDVDFYLCGPTSFMQMVESKLLEMNFAQEKIHKESFTADVEKSNETEYFEYQDRKIKIKVYGQEYEILVEKGDNIITAGIKNGLILPYSCQIGACSTCRAMLVSGKVNMHVREGLTDNEIKQGYILTCQSYPLTDDVVIDFDY